MSPVAAATPAARGPTMKLAFVFVQVALVAAGIFLYDQFRHDESADFSLDEPVEVRRATPAPREIERAGPMALDGTGAEGLARRVEAVERRQSDLERVVAERTTVVRDRGEGTAREETAREGGAGRPWREDAARGGGYGDGSGFSQQELDRFRVIKAEVDRIERHERQVSSMNRQIDRLGVQLDDERRQQIVESTIQYRDAMRARIRDAAKNEESAEARQQALEVLAAAYKQTLYSLATPADADRLFDAFGRYPGFRLPRRGR